MFNDFRCKSILIETQFELKINETKRSYNIDAQSHLTDRRINFMFLVSRLRSFCMNRAHLELAG